MKGYIVLAYKNLLRRKIRSALTLLSVSVGIALLFSLASFYRGYRKSLEEDMSNMGLDLLVTAKGCPYEAATLIMQGGVVPNVLDDTVLPQVRANPLVSLAAPFYMGSTSVPLENGKSSSTVFFGITRDMLKLKPWLKFKAGGYSSAPDSIIMGYEAAELESREVGDKIYFPDIDRVFQVKGILERSGTQDDGIVYVPLETAQNICKRPGKITGIAIKVRDISTISQLAESLNKIPDAQVITLSQIKGTILNLIGSAKSVVLSVVVIALCISAISVFNTVMMTVFERTQEIGVMKALGATRVDVFRILWTEAILLCSLGGVAGIAAAVLLSSPVEHAVRSVIPYVPSRPLTSLEPMILAVCFFVSVALGIVGGLYPALRASMMTPVQAIRSE